MTKPVLLSAILLVFFANPAQSQDEKSVVQLHCMSPMFAYVDDNPIASLASAIAKDKKTAQFRVSWNGSLGSGWDRGTMLYQRKTGLLKYYDVGGGGDNGEEHYQKHYVLKGIREITLISLAKRYNNQKQIRQLFPFSFLETLPKLGYRKEKIIDVQQGF